MKDFDPIKSWDAKAAAQYDGKHVRGDEDAAAEFLAAYVGGGGALELAIGTGRIAIPLTEKGIKVDGIESSPHMVEQLHKKVKNINVTIGDMSTTTTNHQYNVVYLVYNTIFNLLTVDDQINCFKNAAQHLNKEGHFIVETAVPHAWIASGKSDYVKAERISGKQVVFDVARYDPVTQLFEENHVYITESSIEMNPIVCRLITPGEMDLMARIAGLKLVDRFANWQKSVFDENSVGHVSIYGVDI